MKTVAVLQARMGSSRLPGKVMKLAGGEPLLALMLRRLSRSTEIDRLVVATSDQPRDRVLVELAVKQGCAGFAGSESDVLDRYYRAARAESADIVLRMTGDCPLIDPALVDEVVRRFKAAGVDYASNAHPPTFPNGLDVEVFSFAALERAWREASTSYDREHVTPYLRSSGAFSRVNVANDEDLSALRWTVDESADLEVVRNVFTHFAPDIYFDWRAILGLFRAKPKLFEANQAIPRNQGSVLGPGQKLWKRAAALIPGGAMLAEKRSETLLADRWPAYFARAEGCRLWGLDGSVYTDMTMIGGACPLGYRHAEVDDAARGAIERGVVSTLNCPEEVQLAERLVELHPWADMARLARSEGEAVTAAVRLAQAATGRRLSVVCGAGHSGFTAPTRGEGDALGCVVDDLEALSRLARGRRLAAIVVDLAEVVERAFLERVRALCREEGAVLIFDECASGFRETFGGRHTSFGVEPDIAVFGSSLGNGYAIAALIGRREAMAGASKIMAGSASHTERIGPAAALKTLDVMERVRAWEQLCATGAQVARGWVDLGRKHGLAIRVAGSPTAPTLRFDGPSAPVYQTLVTQEMLEMGYLATESIRVCTAHSPKLVDDYLEALDGVFALIRSCEEGRPVAELLKGPARAAADSLGGR